MATVAQMRAWLRDQGENVPERGKLRPDLVTKYEDAHQSAFTDAEAEADAAAEVKRLTDAYLNWDIEDGDDRGIADPEDLEPSVPMTPERAPRTARTARAERRAQPVGVKTSRILGALRGDQGTRGKAKPKGKPKPRMSLEKFTSRAYTSLGRMVSAVAPATGRCITAQAAMAGVLLEDVAHGTIVDRLLQPAARAEDKLDKGFALIAPPVIVFAMEMNNAAVMNGARNPKDGAIRQAMLTPMLRESLRIGLEVSESFADQIKARLESDKKRDAEVDELLRIIFDQPEVVPEPEMAGAAA